MMSVAIHVLYMKTPQHRRDLTRCAWTSRRILRAAIVYCCLATIGMAGIAAASAGSGRAGVCADTYPDRYPARAFGTQIQRPLLEDTAIAPNSHLPTNLWPVSSSALVLHPSSQTSRHRRLLTTFENEAEPPASFSSTAAFECGGV
eukprot:5816303-Pyramimonas_sp.AAC.2